MAGRIKLSWSPQARENLLSIYAYIARQDRRMAKVYVTKIKNQAQSLADFPELGRVVRELNVPNLRERTFDNYRIVYRCILKRLRLSLSGTLQEKTYPTLTNATS